MSRSFLANKNKSFFLSCLCLLHFSFCHGQNDSLSGRFNVELSSFNDSWGGGFTPIHDDLRSYGLKLNLEVPDKFSFDLKLSGLTNKSLGYPLFASRTDEMIISTDVLIKKKLFNAVNVFGKVGIYSIGNYSGDFIQETAHQSFGVKKDTLPYSKENNLSGLFGLKLNSFIKLINFKTSSFCIQPEIETYFIPDYCFTIKPEIPFKINSSNGESISLSIGYNHTSLFTSGNVINKVSSAETGPFIDYKIRMGIFSLGYTIFTNTNFSSGFYGLNLLIGQQTTPYQQTDVASEFGFLSNGNGYYHKLLWNKTNLFPENLMFLFYDQHSTYLQKKLLDYPKSYANYQQLGIGAELNVFKTNNEFQLIPYLGINAGFKRDMVYAGTLQRETAELISPQITGEAGLKIKLPKSLMYKNILWGMDLHYKYTALLTNEHVNFEKENHLKTSSGYTGIGVFVLMDL